MSQAYCWECGKSYARDEVFDIPVFKKGFTIQWCFNCAMKQLEWTEFKLVRGNMKCGRFRIESIEDWQKEYMKVQEETVLCFEAQFRKIKKVDKIWIELHKLVQDIHHENRSSIDWERLSRW